MLSEGFTRNENPEKLRRTSSEQYKRFQKHTSFYRLSGDPELTPRDYERYEKSQELVQKETPSFIVEGLKHGDLSARLGMIEVLAQVPEDQQKELHERITPTIKEALSLKGSDQEELELLRKAITIIPLIPARQRMHLIEQAIQNGSIDIRDSVAKLIETLPVDEQVRLKKILSKQIEQDLQSKNFSLRYNTMLFIEATLQEDQELLLKQAFQDKDQFIRSAVIEQINNVSIKNRRRFIEQALEDESSCVRCAAAKSIDEVPEDEQMNLRKKLCEILKRDLRNEDVFIRRRAILCIEKTLIQNRTSLVEQALQDKNIHNIEEAAEIIDKTPEDEQENLRKKLSEYITQTLHNRELELNAVVARLINYVSKDEQQHLRIIFSERITQNLQDKKNTDKRLVAAQLIDIVQKTDWGRLIELTLADENPEVCYANTKLIERLPEGSEKINLKMKLSKRIRQDLQNEDPDIWSTITKFIDKMDSEQRMDFIQLTTSTQHWKTFAKTTPLYKDVQDPFFVESFSKTGSGTTLLDQGFVEGHESLRNRAIIRHIDIGPYQGWKRAYEDVEFWKNQGFDYVPVEPIVKATLNPQTYRVDVVTRVLPAPSVAIWKQDVGLYTQTIDEQVEKIKKALEALGVAHGHTHENNFIVYFDRDEQGEPILEKPPKVYVIDFDRAVSSQNN